MAVTIPELLLFASSLLLLWLHSYHTCQSIWKSQDRRSRKKSSRDILILGAVISLGSVVHITIFSLLWYAERIGHGERSLSFLESSVVSAGIWVIFITVCEMVCWGHRGLLWLEILVSVTRLCIVGHIEVHLHEHGDPQILGSQNEMRVADPCFDGGPDEAR